MRKKTSAIVIEVNQKDIEIIYTTEEIQSKWRGFNPWRPKQNGQHF